MSKPKLAKITLFPVKALSGVDVASCGITYTGALSYDRQFALKDEDDRFVNGKRHPEVNQIVSGFDLEQQTITVDIYGFEDPQTFELREGNDQLEEWISDFFGFNVFLVENSENGFPDDLQRPGPTVISIATLEKVASWFPDLSVDQIRQRFRTNLELEGCPAFWEDRLNQLPDQGIRFQIGDVLFEGLKHCVRCPVPTQNTETGEAYTDFQKIFTQKREETLPKWIKKSGFDHYYKLAINTRIVHFNAELKLGAKVKL